MFSLIGFYSLIFGLCAALIVTLLSVKNFRDKSIFDNKIISLTLLQLIFVIISFFGLIISFIGLIIVLDTFKSSLYNLFPNLEFFLYSFYETLKDVELFIKDLI